MTDTTTGSRAPTRLPMWRTLSLAYQSVLDNFDVLLRMSWPWLLLVLGPEIVSNWLSHPQMTLRGPPDPVPPPAFGSPGWIFSSLWPFLILIPGSAIAVKWHKYILANQQPSATAPLLPREFWPYFVMALLLGAASYVPILSVEALASAMTDDEDDAATWLPFSALAAATIMIVITSRLAIALPAIAIGGPGQSLAEAWLRTKGMTWRLLFGQFFALVPLVAMSSMVFAIASLLEHRLTFALIAGMLDTVSLLLLTIAVSFLSFAWRHVFAAPGAE